jgi:hypothetical protein
MKSHIYVTANTMSQSARVTQGFYRLMWCDIVSVLYIYTVGCLLEQIINTNQQGNQYNYQNDYDTPLCAV